MTLAGSAAAPEEILSEQRSEAARGKLTPRQEAALEVSSVHKALARMKPPWPTLWSIQITNTLGRIRLVQLLQIGTGTSPRPWTAEAPTPLPVRPVLSVRQVCKSVTVPDVRSTGTERTSWRKGASQ
jgi:hypothetical protein